MPELLFNVVSDRFLVQYPGGSCYFCVDFPIQEGDIFHLRCSGKDYVVKTVEGHNITAVEAERA